MDYHTVRVKTPLCLSVACLTAFVTCVLGQITVKDGYGKYAWFVVSVAPGDKYRLPISEIFNTQSTKNPRYSASGSCGGKVTLSQLSTQLSVQRIAMPDGQSVEFSAAFGRNIAFYKFTNNLVQYFTFKADPTEPKEFVSDGPYNVTFADGEKSLKCFVPVWLGSPTSRIFMACEDRLLAFKPTLDEVAGVLMFNKPRKHAATPYGQVIYFPNQDWLLGVTLTSSSARSVSGWYCTGLTSSRLLDVQCPETLITFEFSDAPVADTFDTVRLKKVKSADGFLAIWSGSGDSEEIRYCRLMIEELKIVCSKVTNGGSPAAVYVDLEIEDPAVGKTGPNNYLGYFNPQTSEYRVSYFNEDKLQIQMSEIVLAPAALDKIHRLFVSPQAQVTAIGNEIADIRGRVHTGNVVALGERVIQRAGNQLRLYSLEPEYLLINGLASQTEANSECNITISAFDDYSYRSVETTVQIRLVNSSYGLPSTVIKDSKIELNQNSLIDVSLPNYRSSNYFTVSMSSSDKKTVDVQTNPQLTNIQLISKTDLSKADHVILVQENLQFVFTGSKVSWNLCQKQTEAQLVCTSQIGSFDKNTKFDSYSVLLSKSGRLAIIGNRVVCQLKTSSCSEFGDEPTTDSTWITTTAMDSSSSELVFRYNTIKAEISVMRVILETNLIMTQKIGTITSASTMRGFFNVLAMCAEQVTSAKVVLSVWSKINDPSQVLLLKYEFTQQTKTIFFVPSTELVLENTQANNFLGCATTNKFLMKEKQGVSVRDQKSVEVLLERNYNVSETCQTDDTKLKLLKSTQIPDILALYAPCLPAQSQKYKVTYWNLASSGDSQQRRFLGSVYLTTPPSLIIVTSDTLYCSSAFATSVPVVKTRPSLRLSAFQPTDTPTKLSLAGPSATWNLMVDVSSSMGKPILALSSSRDEFFATDTVYNLSRRVNVTQGHIFSVQVAGTPDLTLVQDIFGREESQTIELTSQQYYESTQKGGLPVLGTVSLRNKECGSGDDCVYAQVFQSLETTEQYLSISTDNQQAQVILGRGAGTFRQLKIYLLSQSGNLKNVSVLVQAETTVVYVNVLIDWSSTKIQLIHTYNFQSAALCFMSLTPSSTSYKIALVGLSSADGTTIETHRISPDDYSSVPIATVALSRTFGNVVPLQIECAENSGCLFFSGSGLRITSFDPFQMSQLEDMQEHQIPEGHNLKNAWVRQQFVLALTEDTNSDDNRYLLVYRRKSNHTVGAKQIIQQIGEIEVGKFAWANQVILHLRPDFTQEGTVKLRSTKFQVYDDTSFKVTSNKKGEDPKTPPASATLILRGAVKDSQKVFSLTEFFKPVEPKPQPPVNPDTPKSEKSNSALYWIIGSAGILLVVVVSALVYTSCKLKQAQQTNYDITENSKESLIRARVPNGESTFQNESAQDTHTDL